MPCSESCLGMNETQYMDGYICVDIHENFESLDFCGLTEPAHGAHFSLIKAITPHSLEVAARASSLKEH